MKDDPRLCVDIVPYSHSTKHPDIAIMSRVKIVFGTASFGQIPTETSQEFLDILKKHNVKDLDTAYRYVSNDASLVFKERS